MSKFEIMSTFVATLAFFVSIINYFHFRKQTRSEALIACLEQYLQIARFREQAISEKSERLAKLYFQEMFDLLWTEFRLWHFDLIPGQVMRAWLYSRFHNHRQGVIEFTTVEGKVTRISCKDIWEKLTRRGYFDPEDTFLPFMDLVLEGEIDDALKSKVRLVRLPRALFTAVKALYTTSLQPSAKCARTTKQ